MKVNENFHVVSGAHAEENKWKIYTFCHHQFLRYLVFKAFLDILEHWEVVQMIQGTLRDVLKKVAGERPGDLTKLCGLAKIVGHTIFLNFLDVGVFLA